jgi:tetratricopeptide (TPR) repeat protein
MNSPSAAVPQEEWDALLAMYNRRADLDQHIAAAEESATMAARYPDDHFLQIFAARTAYYLAHRLKDSGARHTTALRGVDAASRALQADHTDYDARYWHAMTTFRAREAEGIKAALKGAKQARDYMLSMLRDDPGRFEAHMLLGVLFRELPPLVSFGDKKKAMFHLEEGARLAPRDPEMLLELAAGYRKVGRKKEARATYQRVIDDSTAPPYGEWEADDARQYARKMLRKILF